MPADGDQSQPLPHSREVELHRHRDGEPLDHDHDRVAAEEPLEIRVRGKSVGVTMRTPGGDAEDAELAAGFLAGEGIVTDPRDIVRIDPCRRAIDGNIINVFLAPHVAFDAERLARNVYASSSCGLCGKASIEAVHQHFDPIDAGKVSVPASSLPGMASRLRQAQAVFEQTGGLHAAGLFDRDGSLVTIREDVGRHNAVDKVIGNALLSNRWPLDRSILVVSGRASFEIMQKALAARIAVVCAISAPSSLAVELAIDSNMTLIGFLRDRRWNAYAGVQRIAQHDTS